MRNSILTLLLCLLILPLAGQNPPTTYAVQLAAFNEPVSKDYFEGFEGVYFVSIYGGTMYKYFTEDCKSKNEAMQLAEKARKAGHANAKIINMDAYRAGSSNCCKAPDGTVSINNIFFDFDKSNLRTASVRELDNAIMVLNQNPGFTIEVRAHTDAKGTNEYNDALSARRRDAAIEYLKAKGIAASRIKASIHGENDPVAINQTQNGEDSPAGRQYNRRVELIIRDPKGAVKAADTDFVPDNLKQ
ncbi:MAG: OmpA family protein [Bacteroidia bacterium]